MGCLGFLFIGLPGRGGAKRCAWEWHYRLEEKCRDKFESSISLLGISVVYCYGSRMGGVEYIDIFLGYRFEGRGKGEMVWVKSPNISLLTIAEEGDILGETVANMIL